MRARERERDSGKMQNCAESFSFPPRKRHRSPLLLVSRHSLPFDSSAAFSTAAPARRVGKTCDQERAVKIKEEERKSSPFFPHFSTEGKNLKLNFQTKIPFFNLLFSAASCTSALPVRAFKETGSSAAPSKSKQGGLRALKNIELPKIDLLSKVELPQIALDEIKLPTADDAAELAAEAASRVSLAWERSDEKPAVVALGASALVALVALSAVAAAVDALPVVSDLLELVGLGASAWFAYRNLVFGPDRDELKLRVEALWSKVFP